MVREILLGVFIVLMGLAAAPDAARPRLLSDAAWRAALERGDLQQVARHTLDSRLSPETYEDDFSGILLELGDEFAASDQRDNAVLAYRVGLYFFPGHEDLESALEAHSRR